MAKLGSGIQIDSSEMDRLRGRQESDPADQIVEKKELSTGSIIFRVILVIIAAGYFFLLFFGKYFLPEDNEFLLSLNVFSGTESPNRLIRILSLAILTLSISAVLRFVIGRLARNKTITRRTGVAIIALLGNLVKYISIIVLIFLVLSALGVNTTELLAGLGILSLILGLGLTSLIEDIVAGVFIIAERLYDVGDIVVVEDFRGCVISIGIRSTQIEDEGGDILILRNSDVRSLINMTHHISTAVVDIPISPLESFEHVEEVLQNFHLEKLREKYPEIERGPLYLGLSEINSKGVQVITLIADCQESKKYSVQRILNRELTVLFHNNGILLGEGPDDDDDDDDEED